MERSNFLEDSESRYAWFGETGIFYYFFSILEVHRRRYRSVFSGRTWPYSLWLFQVIPMCHVKGVTALQMQVVTNLIHAARGLTRKK